jgi:ATP-dependent protease ClpP protease subunit
MKHRKQLKPFFNASTNGGTLEMMLYNVIGGGYYDGVTAEDIKQQMDEAGAYTNIVMRINSPGGDAFEGIAIHNLLRASKKPVETVVDGLAASAASIVAMAGDKITIAHNAMMMIHNASAVCVGNASDMRKEADTLDKVSASIAQTYVDRTGTDLETVQAMMDEETWMSADDCIKNGFATQLSEDPADAGQSARALALARSFKTLRDLKNVPAVLKNEDNPDDTVCACDCDNCSAGDCSNCSNVGCDDPNCIDCPMQDSRNDGDDAPEDSNLSLYEARVSLLKLKSGQN